MNDKSGPRIMSKSCLLINSIDLLNFVPRCAYGELAQVAQRCGANDGNKLTYNDENTLLLYAIHPTDWATRDELN